LPTSSSAAAVNTEANRARAVHARPRAPIKFLMGATVTGICTQRKLLCPQHSAP
jgi:hypothetical protein